MVDLSSLRQIQRFSHDFAHSGRKLHVLINNAATMQDARGETAEGVEMAQVRRGWMVQSINGSTPTSACSQKSYCAPRPPPQTIHQHDTTQATNLLGFYGLTQGLLSVLKANAPARIVNVVSAGMLATVRGRLCRILLVGLAREEGRKEGRRNEPAD